MTSIPHVMAWTRAVSSGDCDADRRRWLSQAERDELDRLHDPGRRGEWLAGRWLLKHALQQCLRQHRAHTEVSGLDEIEILSRDALGRGQRPRAFVTGRLLPWDVSVAHEGGMVGAAVCTNPGTRVGIDVVSQRSATWIAHDWLFTVDELEWMRRADDDSLAATVWAVKEAVYKAANRGEAFVPVRIAVSPDSAGGMTCSYEVVLPRSCSVTISCSGAAVVVVATVDNCSARTMP